MSLVTLSNLYPRPDRPQMGMFNARLFTAMAETLEPNVALSGRMRNVCLVPEWRLWRWPEIRLWRDPFDAALPTTYIPVPYLPMIGRNLSPYLYGLATQRLRRSLRLGDHLYASWLYPDAVLGADLSARCGCAAWGMALGSDGQHLDVPARRRQVLRASAELHGIVCVSRPLVERLSAAGIDRARLHHVPNGVDTRHFLFRTREAALRALQARGAVWTSPITPAERVVLFVGNLVDVKNPGMCLDGFARCLKLLSGGAKTRLIFLGDGPLKPTLEAAAEQAGIGDAVHFLGSRHYEEVALWMNVADVLALTSRSEGMPNVVLEALASGLPVLATDVGACREMLAGETCGRIVAGDAASLATALLGMLDGTPDRVALAARHGQYSWHDQARKILELMGLSGGEGKVL